MPSIGSSCCRRLASWAFDPVMINATQLLSAATMYFIRIPTPQNITVANVQYGISTVASGNTHGFVAAYDSSGNKLAQSADQSTAWQSTGGITTALAYSVVGGIDAFHWIVFYCGTGTPPTLRSINNNALATIQTALGPNARRYGTIAQADTATLPTPITPSGIATAGSIPAVVLT